MALLVEAKSREGVGSIPNGVFESFHRHNPGVDSVSNRNEY